MRQGRLALSSRGGFGGGMGGGGGGGGGRGGRGGGGGGFGGFGGFGGGGEGGGGEEGGDRRRGRGRGRGGEGGEGGRGRGGDDERDKLIENVVRINRNATVVKGGRRFSFSALVVVGDGKGRVGIGYGKANGVPNAVEKGVKDARKNMFRVPILEGTIPHETKAEYGASQAFLAPASPGTGIIAGASVRAVVEAAGVKNILTKSFGSTNPINLCKAAELALKALRTRRDVEKLRGVSLDERAGTWHTKESAARKGGLSAGTPVAAA